VAILLLLHYLYTLHFICQIVPCLDTQCAKLMPSTDGLKMTCFNGVKHTTGMSYVGDICNFKCSTGYELIGSKTRTCQSDETWSGREAMCNRGNYKFVYWEE